MRFGKESIDEEIELDGNRGDEKVEWQTRPAGCLNIGKKKAETQKYHKGKSKHKEGAIAVEDCFWDINVIDEEAVHEEHKELKDESCNPKGKISAIGWEVRAPDVFNWKHYGVSIGLSKMFESY